MSSHVPACVRAALHLKVSFIRAFRDTVEELGEVHPWKALASLRDELKLRSVRAFAKSPAGNAGQHIQEFLSSASRDIEALSSAPDTRERAQAFLLWAPAVDCMRCAEERGTTPCDGNLDRESQLVDKRGECVAWLFKIFDEIVSYCKSKYLPFMTNGTASNIILCTTHMISPEAAEISGGIELKSSDYNLQSKITLTFGSSFNKNGLYSIAYVIFHEVMRHAFQDIRRGLVADRTRDEECPFTECWMDAIAYLFLKNYMKENNEAGGLLSNIWPVDDIISQSGLKYNQRYNLGPANYPGYWQYGRNAHCSVRRVVRDSKWMFTEFWLLP